MSTRRRAAGHHARFLVVSLATLPIVFGAWGAPAPTPPAPTPPATLAPEGTVPVHIAGIQLVEADQVVLLLADEREERALPMAIGRDQGLAIYLGKERTATPRPMTHDLLVEILKALGGTIERVTITEIKDGTYYASIALRSAKGLQAIDARPSDAVALAVRLDAPIFAARDLLHSLTGPERPELQTHADRALGLRVQALDADLAEVLGAKGVPGVLVAGVTGGGPADGAGVRRGDILQSLRGRPTPDVPSFLAAAGRTDGPARLDVWREGRTMTLVVR